MKKSIYYVAASIGLLTVIACGSDPSNPSQDDLDRLSKEAGSSSAPVADKPKQKLITEGDWEIGTKEDLDAKVITPGTYIIASSEDGYNCYYKVVNDFDQTLESIITNGNIDPGKTTRIVIKKSYAGLTLDGSCVATKKK